MNATWVVDGEEASTRWLSPLGWSEVPVVGAEPLPGRYAVHGLVDAHSHVSFGMASGGPVPLDAAAAAHRRGLHGHEGVTLLRDAGGIPDVVLGMKREPGVPELVPAGRHLAPPGYYFVDVHQPVAPDDVVDVVRAEIAMGARWVKLVADFSPARASNIAAQNAPPEQTYDLDVIARVIDTAHAAGARVAAHVTTSLVGDLVNLGLDSVEHGPALDEVTVIEMGRRGTAWVPTLCALLAGERDQSEDVRHRTAALRDRLTVLLVLAQRVGVPILTGSDVVGSVPREAALLVSCGLTPEAALRAATTAGRAFIAEDTTAVPASVVTYHGDPRADPKVLGDPVAVIIDGVRVR